MNGGYDEGYRRCSCFWGQGPGSLVVKLGDHIGTFTGLQVLDAGCGEGKNAIFLARKGAVVTAIDVSMLAHHNARQAWGSDCELVQWEVADILSYPLMENSFDLIIAYGLLHCLTSKEQIDEIVDLFKRSTKARGYNLICAFNNRHQDLSAHPGFSPTLLAHMDYLKKYRGWDIVYQSDQDLTEQHPHNNLWHTHSMTRMIARKER